MVEAYILFSTLFFSISCCTINLSLSFWINDLFIYDTVGYIIISQLWRSIEMTQSDYWNDLISWTDLASRPIDATGGGLSYIVESWLCFLQHLTHPQSLICPKEEGWRFSEIRWQNWFTDMYSRLWNYFKPVKSEHFQHGQCVGDKSSFERMSNIHNGGNRSKQGFDFSQVLQFEF